MSAIAQFATLDAATTPVSHTFVPITSGPMTMYRESSSSLPIYAQSIVTFNAKKLRIDGGLSLIDVTLELPVMEAAIAQNAQGYTAAPKVAYVMKAKTTFFLPGRSTQQQRKDLRKMHSAIMLGDSTNLVALIDSFEIPY